MAEVKWIKIVTDIFDDEKILLIEGMPEADSIIVIWFKLLCMAGKQNNGGTFMLNDKIAYTDEMLATIFRRPLNTVRLALKTFQMYGMIEIVENVITIPNWNKHQSLDKLEKAKEQTRQRVAACRERKKQQKEIGNAPCNAPCNVTVTECNTTEEDKDIDIDTDIERENYTSESPQYTPSQIVALYHATCPSLQPVEFMTDKREQAIADILKVCNVERFKKCFEMAEASSFLKGENERGWRASFDWLCNPANMAKVLEGNFTDRKSKESNGSFDTGEFYLASVRKSFGDDFDPSILR